MPSLALNASLFPLLLILLFHPYKARHISPAHTFIHLLNSQSLFLQIFLHIINEAKMQFFTVATLFLATAFAAPSDSHGHGVARRQAAPDFCPPGLLYSNPQCCGVDVLGLADLDCVVRKWQSLLSNHSINQAESANIVKQLLRAPRNATLLAASAPKLVARPSAVLYLL